MDEDSASSDDILGTKAIDLYGRKADTRWTLDEWIPILSDEGKSAGSVQLQLEWIPDPPLPQKRYLRATVVAAKDLQKMDTFGKDDPYCMLKIAGEDQRTR